MNVSEKSKYISDQFRFSSDLHPLTDKNEFVCSEQFNNIVAFHSKLFGDSVPSLFSRRIPILLLPELFSLLQEYNFQLLAINNDARYGDLYETFYYLNNNKILLKLQFEKVDNSNHPMPQRNIGMFDKLIQKTLKTVNKKSEEDSIFIIEAAFYSGSNIEFFDKICYEISEFEKSTSKNSIYIFEKDSYGEMNLIPHKISSIEIDIKKHYNDDFERFHNKMDRWTVDFETKNNRLLLLHGDAGTGKTNYIKNFLAKPNGVKKIYIPPYYVQALADPAFFGFIRNYSNSLLIIEDAEKILISRENEDSGAMSILLNLTDGILADVLNFKIICTFNTDESKIDDALKRKGRLFDKYFFGPLTEEKTEKLWEEVHPDSVLPKDRMTLAEIYNPDDNGVEIKKKNVSIGFGI